MDGNSLKEWDTLEGKVWLLRKPVLRLMRADGGFWYCKCVGCSDEQAWGANSNPNVVVADSLTLLPSTSCLKQTSQKGKAGHGRSKVETEKAPVFRALPT